MNEWTTISRLPGLPRDKLLATIVRLLETTFIRVGNEWYARTNSSFGLTTLKNRHVDVQGSRIRFKFRGKSGKFHVVQVSDRRLARLVKRSRDLPGQDLFQYLDEAGEAQPIGSEDVNDYIKLIAEQDFTAKDFRTWGGTLIAAQCLAASGRLRVEQRGEGRGARGDRHRGRATGQHRRDLPQVLHPPSRARSLHQRGELSALAETERRYREQKRDWGLEENALFRYLSSWPGPAQNGLAPSGGGG